MSDFLIQQLQLGLQQLKLDLSSHQQQQLLAYLDLLAKWNVSYNLTAIRDPEAMLVQHLLDSLAIYPYIPTGKLLDVGTGGGLPGIPLAIVFPEREWVLLDSNGKKCRFLIQVKHSLKLHNVAIVQSRAEQMQAQFTGIISRAFATLADMLQNTQHLCSNEGIFLAMKGGYPQAELAEIPLEFRVQRVLELNVPLLEAKRHLVIIGKQHG